MSGSALSLIGQMEMLMYIWLYLQIQTKYQIQINALLWCSIQIQIHQIFVYKYVSEPNPAIHQHCFFDKKSANISANIHLKISLGQIL